MSTTPTKSQFLLQHPRFLRCRVSNYFPFTFEELKRYRDILYWDCLAGNENIEWDMEIVDEFCEQLWDKDGFFPEFNMNPALPWSVEFIQRYLDYVSWELLSQNETVARNEAILYHFAADFEPYHDNIKMYRSKEEKDLSAELEIERMAQHPELRMTHPDEHVLLDFPNWWLMSQNTLFDWNIEMMARYEERWNWSQLELNKSIPWNLAMLERFEHRMEWPVETGSDIALERNCVTSGITVNFSVVWTKEMLKRYGHKLDPVAISHNKVIPWDFEMVLSFMHFLEPADLALNDQCWSRVFPEFDQRENLLPLLEALRSEWLN